METVVGPAGMVHSCRLVRYTNLDREDQHKGRSEEQKQEGIGCCYMVRPNQVEGHGIHLGVVEVVGPDHSDVGSGDRVDVVAAAAVGLGDRSLVDPDKGAPLEPWT